MAGLTVALIGGPVAAANAAPDGGDLLYRYYKSDGTHFYTAVEHEARLAVSYPDYRYEGVVGAISFAGADAALYRFYKSDGTHFFTANAYEASQVKSYSNYSYEGIAGFVASAASVPAEGLLPVYRFYKQAAGTHFYTASANEADQVKAYPEYSFEGIAYYIKAADGPAPQPYPQPSPQPVHVNGVTPGAFCSPEGATGTTTTGKAMVCKTTATDPKARWRAA